MDLSDPKFKSIAWTSSQSVRSHYGSISAKNISLSFVLIFLSVLFQSIIVGILGRIVLYYRRSQWYPTAVLLPRKSHGRRSLVGCSPWSHEESARAERLHFHFSHSCFGEGNGNPLQCSCLENPRDGGAWWVAVYGVAQSRTRLKRHSSSSSSSPVVWTFFDIVFLWWKLTFFSCVDFVEFSKFADILSTAL